MARTVLLADDSVTAQNMGRRILMDAGYDVITVNNGSAALKKIHENRPDLIVLDVYMPGYGGLEVCQRLKESDETMRIPVLLTVGKMEPFKADEAKRVRADGHIVKPFEASELLAALTRLEDRIVPQAEALGRGGKSADKGDKKSRFWRVNEPESDSVPRESTAKSAYLSEIKQRNAKVQSEPDSTVIVPAPEPQHSPQEAAPIASAAPANTHEREAPASLAPDFELNPRHTTIDEPEQFNNTNPDAPADEPAIAPQPEPVVVAPVIVPSNGEAPRWVAENVPLTAEEASLALEHEMQQAQAEASVQVPSPGPTEEPAAEEEKLSSEHPPHHGSAAFAAAASAGTTPIAGMPVVVPDGGSSDLGSAFPSEAAAAWENWQQIRDSVMAPQQTAATAESVAKVVQASTSCETSEPSVQRYLEGNAIASIVDSVLAELKPKLMEEIAKKMAAEKK